MVTKPKSIILKSLIYTRELYDSSETETYEQRGIRIINLNRQSQTLKKRIDEVY